MDLLLDENNDLVFINGECPVTVTQQEVVGQRLKITLQTFLEEWFLDLDVGIPYFQHIFQKHKDKSSVDTIFQQAILNDPGVIELLSYESTLEAASRRFALSFEVDVSDNSALGRMIGVVSPAQADLWEAMQQVYNSFNPNVATGIALDNIVALSGITRFPAL